MCHLILVLLVEEKVVVGKMGIDPFFIKFLGFICRMFQGLREGYLAVVLYPLYLIKKRQKLVLAYAFSAPLCSVVMGV